METIPAGYRAVAGETGVPEALLYAIALTESGTRLASSGRCRPWPWTLNIAGEGHWYPSRAAAWRGLTEALAQGERSIDIGLMQVNWRYHQERLGTAWEALDPYHNLRVGARILRACYATRDDWWDSAGCYHAPADQDRATRYRARVNAHWRTIVEAGRGR